MAKKEKARRTYRDSSENDIETLGSTQESGAPRILKSNASSSPAKRAAAPSYARRHRSNYRGDSDAEDGDDNFVASPLDDNDDEDLSDIKVVEKARPKIHRRGLGQKGEGEVLPQQYPPRGPLLGPPKNSSVRSQPPRGAPLRGPQSDLPTNSRVRYRSYQPARQVPNTPYHIRSVGRDNS